MAERLSIGTSMADQLRQLREITLELLRENAAYALAVIEEYRLTEKGAGITGRDIGFQKLQLCQGGNNLVALARDKQAQANQVDQLEALEALLQSADIWPITDELINRLQKEAAGQKALDLVSF